MSNHELLMRFLFWLVFHIDRTDDLFGTAVSGSVEIRVTIESDDTMMMSTTR